MNRHVAVDVRMARDSGIGTYIRHILPRVIALRPEWTFTMLGSAADLDRLGGAAHPNVEARECTARIYTIAEQVELVRKIPRTADLFWSPHYNIPVLHPGRIVVTVHDVLHLAMPQYVRNPAKRAYARLMFAAVRHRARGILTVSDFSRREYRRFVGAGGADPVVVHNGIAAEWFAVPPATPGSAPARPYVVFVGNVKPHKNLGTLIRAFATLVADLPHDLVIAGRREGLRGPDPTVQGEADGLGGRVRFAGEISDTELRSLVAGATALVMPSLYEGFGLPPLEAMAVGCPALVARSASLPEVCGDAAMYCDPHDAADMGRALRTLLTDDALRAQLRARGRVHVRQYDWDRSAAGTLTVLENAMTGS